MSEPTGTEYPEEGQPVTTPEPIEAVEEASPSRPIAELADAADEYEAEVGNAAEIPVVFTERPVQTVGRRKEAVVRVRLMPGTGKFTLNGKSLETYFPNKLHQQLIREPLVTVEKTERVRRLREPAGRRHLRPGRCAAAGHRPRAHRGRRRGPSAAQDAPASSPGTPGSTERKKYGLKKARKAPQYSKR